MTKKKARYEFKWSHLIPVALLASASAAHANTQSRTTISTVTPPTAPVGLDVHVGTTLANVSYNGDSGGFENNNKLGLDAGIGYDLGISRIFSFHPEFNYVQKGVNADQSFPVGDGTNVNAEISINLNYVELPLLLKAQLPDGPFRPNLVAGPSVGYLVSKGASYSVNGAGINKSGDGAIDEGAIKSWDYGVMFGAGAEIPVGKGNSIIADFRYDLGLANISNGSGDNDAVKNRTMMMTLGFKL